MLSRDPPEQAGTLLHGLGRRFHPEAWVATRHLIYEESACKLQSLNATYN